MIIKLNPGKCRHQFVIQYNKNASTDLTSYGRDSVSSTDLGTIKAEFRRLVGEERVIANQEFGLATHELACWYLAGITNSMWLIGFNGKRYNIVDVDDVEEKHQWLHMILASESS